MDIMAKREPKRRKPAKNPWPARLKAIRDKYALTQTQAAEKIGTVLRSWQNWEYGRTMPNSAVQHLILTTFPMD